MTVAPTIAPGLLPPVATPDASAATNYTDLNALESLKHGDPSSPQTINAVTQQVEALFLQMMLQSMREASMGDDLDGNEMGVYQDMFDKQVALTISQHDDLGIGNLFKRQLTRKIAPAAPKSASGAAAAAPIAQTPAEFVNKVMPTIRRAASALKLNPDALLAQAALETGWGQRMPRTADGASSLNLFGIKAGDDWAGERATADTVEYSNGVAAPRRTAFRAYGSIEESVTDFAKLLASSPRYRDVMESGNDAQAYVASIARSGYATDPEYGNKLNQILNSGTLQAALLPRTAAL
ncbi:MAG TPA: glucosaminidase domain-containing protein [Steroidobacteraceae bacterium]|jgi:flagellar protein FlgJ|nr:glucosaminidase domain-containing protein [Steroidobacteraceae bacterium]